MLQDEAGEGFSKVIFFSYHYSNEVRTTSAVLECHKLKGILQDQMDYNWYIWLEHNNYEKNL
jgi:hypothetical protein